MATGDTETGMEELLEAAGLGYADEVVRLCGEHPELPQQDVPDGEGAKVRLGPPHPGPGKDVL